MFFFVLAFSILCLTLAVVAARRRHFLLQTSRENQSDYQSPVEAVSLFQTDARTVAEVERQNRRRDLQQERARTLAWASLIEFADLPEIKNIADNKLRFDALEILTERAATDEEVRALVQFVLANEPSGASKQLLNRFQKIWEQTPDCVSTAQFFRLAAAAGDAELFLDVLNSSEQLIAAGKLRDLSASELRELANSHYWLLPESARISGAGFLLKQKLMLLQR